MKTHSVKIALSAGVFLCCLAAVSFADMSSYTAVPPFVSRGGVDANVLLDLSIEWPSAGAAYNDQDDTELGGTCTGRVLINGQRLGTCYFKDKEYLGYFDPNKCYSYSGDRFVPCGATNDDHECSGQWSGNFLNWGTMGAIDELRWALTGGNRCVDTTSETVLERANVEYRWFHLWRPAWPVKVVGSAYNVSPAAVTPFTDDPIYIYNHDYEFTVFNWCCDTDDYENGVNSLGNYYARVKVCDPSQGLEENCVYYGAYYKPEGLIQRNADRMRFAVMGYALDNNPSRGGGVLRSNMKHVGPTLSTGADNPRKEYGEDGIFIQNPEGAA